MPALFRLISALLILACAGCGSMADTPAPPQTSGISGKALSGGASVAYVSIKDATGTEKSTYALPDGSYAITTAGLQPPYMLKAVFDNSSTAYSFATTDTGSANINSTTTGLAQLAAGLLRLGELYLVIKAELLLIVAGAFEWLAGQIS